MRVLRGNKDSVMAMLEAFVYDPLINWRLVKTGEGDADNALAAMNSELLPSNVPFTGVVPLKKCNHVFTHTFLTERTRGSSWGVDSEVCWTMIVRVPRPCIPL